MPGIKGMKRTKEHNAKIASSLRGKVKSEAHRRAISSSIKKRLSVPEANPNYRGDAVGYMGIHRWLIKTFGHATHCEECGVVGKRINNKWNIDYALIRGMRYERKRENFKMLCNKHHVQYDRLQNNLHTL